MKKNKLITILFQIFLICNLIRCDKLANSLNKKVDSFEKKKNFENNNNFKNDNFQKKEIEIIYENSENFDTNQNFKHLNKFFNKNQKKITERENIIKILNS